MKVTVERTPESEAVLNVELDWTELEKASDRAYHKLAQKYSVPGFRKGHAPRSMLERMLGKEAIYQEGLEDLIESTYRDAVKQNDLTPLGQPSLDAPPLEMGQPYSFTARVPVLPEVQLGDYSAIRVAAPSVEVTDEDIEKVLKQVQDDQAMWLPAERPAQLGDKVVMDLKLTSGDRSISDLHDNEFELAAERAGIFSGMDEQIVGMTEGESKQFTTTIPEDYANADFAGKEAQYDVTLKGVKYRELPEIDDELAKSVGDYENVDALREAIRAQLQSQKESESRRTVRDEAVKQVTDAAQVEVHPVLVDEEVHRMMDETRRMLEQSRIPLEQYLEMMGKSEEEYHKELEPDAQARAKRDLVLDAVAEREGLSISDTELQSWLDMYAAIGGRRLRLRDLRPGQRVGIESSLLRDKAIERLVEIATANAASGPAEAPEAAEAAEAPESGAKAAAQAAAEAAPESATAEEAAEAAEPVTPVAAANVAPAAPPESAMSAPKAAAKASAAPAGATNTLPPEATATEPEAGIPAPAESDV